MTEIPEQSLSKRLRARTHATHERLDKSIMAAAGFSRIESYARFVGVQYLFHRDIEALYDDAALQTLLPGLGERRRLALIAADLADMDLDLPKADQEPAFTPDAVDMPTALGWLYVAEGSNMGAALLRKEVAKLGLSDDHGARHLAPAAEGPAAHWRIFTTALDATDLSPDEEDRAVAGAEAAFTRVQSLVDARFG